MCYSAVVSQNAAELSRKFGARIQFNLYGDLFRRRLAGEKLLINKAMEAQFTHGGGPPEARTIAADITVWHQQRVRETESELFTQKRRLAAAERSLAMKATRKAENEKRIAGHKIEKLLRDHQRHLSLEVEGESEERIFPLHYMSMLALNAKGEKVILPVRYLLRPNGESEAFDRKFGGCYNARLDSLDTVKWWKSALGKRHGLILVKRFYENVDSASYRKKFSPSGTVAENAGKTTVLCFEPEGAEYMFIPTLWDFWRRPDEPTLYSAALITDDPAPDVAAAGHDRTPIFLRESAVDRWLHAKGRSVKELRPILDQREHPRYSHRIVSAA